MRKAVRLCLAVMAVLLLASYAGATKWKMVKTSAETPATNPKAALDTVFFDDFETDQGWTVGDMAVQPPYWHIDDFNAYGGMGHSFWCGTETDTMGWAVPPGYGDGWAQFLISPEIDLTGVTADTVVLKYWQNNRLESPDPGQDWDCINVWITTNVSDSTWNFEHWNYIFPDTVRFPGTGYNVDAPYAWTFVGLCPDGTFIPGWGGIVDWHQVAFDLSAYKGQRIKLAFIGASDAAQSDQSQISPVNYDGMWYLDNLSVDSVSAGGASGNIFFEDCETGMGDWYAHGKAPVYYWHQTARRANSPVNSWWNGTDSTGVYKWGQSDAMTSPVIDLRPVRTTDPCWVDFKLWADVPDDGNDSNALNDWWKIQASSDSGRNWIDLSPYIFIDSSKAWMNQSDFEQLDLSSFVGTTVMVRIGFGSDGDNNVGEGLYIDDFIIWGKTREPLPPPSTVLLVDNDGNAVDLNMDSWTKYLEASLAGLGYRYSVVTIGANKELTPGYLEQYPAVVWNLGGDFDGRMPDYAPISASNKQLLMNYLDSGGNLWICGQKYLGFGNPDTSAHPNLWSDYLHLSPDNGWWSSTTYGVAGVPGDPIGDGFSDTLEYQRLNGASVGWTFPWFAYSLTPDTPAVAVHGFMRADDGSFNGLRYQDAGAGYKFVHTSFPFEALAGWQGRDTLMSRVLGWFLADTLDYLPPQVPTGLAVQQDSNAVICAWRANGEPDLAGYRVYRAVESGQPSWGAVGTVAAPDTVFSDTTVAADVVYAYAVAAYDQSQPANESLFSDWAFIRILPWDKTGGTGGPGGVPVPFALHQNTPNPARGSTTVRFSLPEACRVELTVYNILGQTVATLARGTMGAGSHSIPWNAKDASGRALASGCYFYRLEAAAEYGGRRYDQTRNMVILP